MNKQNQLIHNSLPLIAAGLGDKLGVRITVSGNQAWTDGKTINIPDFNIKSKEHKDAVLGFVSHEAAHLKFDSFNLQGDFSSAALQNYWNIFEDLRIENAMIESMVGTKNWINQIWINRQNDGSRPPIQTDAEPASCICELLLMTCRVNHRGQTHVQPYLDAAEDAFCLNLGFKLYMQVNNLLSNELPNLSSSKDAYDLAVKVNTLINEFDPDEDEPDEPDEPSPDSSSQTPEESNPGDSASPDESNEPDSSDETDEGAGQANDAESEESNSQGSDNSQSSSVDPEQSMESEGNNSSSNSTSSGQHDLNQPTSEQIRAAIQAANDSTETFDDMSSFAQSLEVLAEANPEQSRVSLPEVINVDPISGIRWGIESNVNSTSSQITAKLQSIVEHEMRVRCRTKSSGLKLNSKTLHRYAVNDARLFKQKSKKLQIDTVVEVCVDNSGSMTSRNLMSTAREAQLALAQALSRINGVGIGASAFPDSDCDSNILNLLDEGESVSKLAMRYHKVDGRGDSTPTASALWHCIRKVCSSRKHHKVIIIITDGYPNGGQREELARLVSKATQSGITVIGVAIGTISSNKQAFYQYFPNALFIQDIRELKSELFKVAKDILVTR